MQQYETFSNNSLLLSCWSQEVSKYLVYIFHEDWKRNSLKWNTGDYLWIVPYDTCCTKVNISDIKPLFVTEEQINNLEDTHDLGIGNLPIVLNDKSDNKGYVLFKKKKLIQEYEYKNLCSGIKRKLSVYVVPIKAICRDDYLGHYKKSVMRIDGPLIIWDDFWKNDFKNKDQYLFCDFSLFKFIISYGGDGKE